MSLKVVLAVQGEGRGHLTQAIVACELLKQQGYEVTGILVGGTNKHRIPAYFRKRISSPVYKLESPGFVRDKQNKSVRIGPTVFKAFKQVGRYIHGLRFIREVVRRQQPDLLINFYEPLVGLAHAFRYISVPTLSVAHQYLFLHPQFVFSTELTIQSRLMLRMYTRLTAMGSKQMLALSFYPLADQHDRALIVCPPLLRHEVRLAEPFEGNHLLVYLVNAGYMDNVIAFHLAHPEVKIHCFTDSNTVKDKWEFSETLTFHSLDDHKFLRFMANAAAVVTTAGFESVCEAFYLGKKLLMIPVEGHAEQQCNAFDAEKAGLGRSSKTFNLLPVLNHSTHTPETQKLFQDWVNRFPDTFIDAVNKLLQQQPAFSTKEEQPEDLSELVKPGTYSME